MNSYLIVLLPPKGITKTMDGYRKKYARYTHYNIPPHITIYPPFFLKDITERQLITKLKRGLSSAKSNIIILDTIDYFRGRNNVAFVKPDTKSRKYIADLLVKIVKPLEGYTRNIYGEYDLTPNKFNPHMTIAERIPKDHLPKVKKDLLSFNHVFTFKVISICIFKKPTDIKSWKILQDIPLSTQ